MGMKACLYLRYSDDSQRDGTTFEVQRAACDLKLKNEGWSVFEVIKDDAKSADPNKSNYTHRIDTLLKYCKKNKGKFQILLVYHTSRFARSAEEHLYLRKALLELGIFLRSATENLGETYTDKYTETILAAGNEFENSRRRVNTTSGLWMRVEQGLWPWQPPIGYKVKTPRIISSNGKALLQPFVIDDTCAWAIKEIFKKYSTGTVTKVQLAKEYQKLKIKDSDDHTIRFSPQTIDNVLKKIYYAGFLPHTDGRKIEGKHEPLITLDLYKKCQQEVKVRSNNATRTRVKENPLFPLRKFVRCIECGEPMTGANQKHQYPLYWCYNDNCTLNDKSIKKADLENAFFEYLKLVKPKQDFVERFKKRVLSKYEKLVGNAEQQYKDNLNKIKDLQETKDWIIAQGRKFIFDEDTLKEELQKNKEALDLAKLELNNTHKEELNLEVLLAEAERFINHFEQAWYDAPSEIKSRLQRWLFPSGVTYLKKLGKISFRTEKLNTLFEVINDLGAETMPVLQNGEPSGSGTL